jgi:hypothetical protein
MEVEKEKETFSVWSGLVRPYLLSSRVSEVVTWDEQSGGARTKARIRATSQHQTASSSNRGAWRARTKARTRAISLLKTHMKTATILFYVSPSLETRIKNVKTIDLMEVEKEKEKNCTRMRY